MQIVWITGAGRCGTHLVAMLADGHPRVNAFPVEFRIVQEWIELLAVGSTDGRCLPGRMLDKYLISKYLTRSAVKALFESTRVESTPDDGSRTYSLLSYLESINQRLYGKPENHFLFHCPGCQLSTFFASDSRSDFGRVVIMLRHPVQNYLAWIDHYLQKGGGYQHPEKVRPDIGLSSVLHLSLFRVLKAFYVAMRFRRDGRVLISRLEDFTASLSERQRVWDFLEISTHPTLQTATRANRPQDAGSGKWKTSQIRKVTTDIYHPALAEDEYLSLKKCEYIFSEFYPSALEHVVVVPNEKARELLYDREMSCLMNNVHAREKRNKRLLSLFRERPSGVRASIKWPLRALYTVVADTLLYPQLRMMRSKKSYETASKDLRGVPDLVGLGMSQP